MLVEFAEIIMINSCDGMSKKNMLCFMIWSFTKTLNAWSIVSHVSVHLAVHLRGTSGRHNTNTAACQFNKALVSFICLFSFQTTKNLGQEEGGGAPVQSLADLEEAIPNSLETSLAEVSHAPPSATRMAPVT